MSEQQGWRLCRKCLSSCYAGLPGVCAAGGPHDFQGSRWYAIPWAAPQGVQSQVGWRWCRKCQVLFHPGEGAGSCPAGGGHEHPEGNPYLLAYTPYPAGGQEGFRYCGKCHAMHLPGASGAGPCPSGGVHSTSPSLEYSMRSGVPQGCSIPQTQPGWRRCRKCHSTCFGGIPGACAGGGLHDFQGSAWYGLPVEAISGGNSQDGWRYCKKCQVLFHPGEGPGLCPGGGAHEQDPTGCSYRLAFSPYATDGQEGWRYCGKCHALHLGDGSAGACPAGGEHTDTSSLPYSMLLQVPMASVLRPSQPGWRRCRKCQASCFGGLPGDCAAGLRHDFGDSAWYDLPTEAPYGINRQDGWRYCKKCQVLFHPGLGAGSCPAGGGHEQDPTGSNYHLAISPYPTDGQEGWRYCGKCHVMHLPGATPGSCAAGGVHTDSASAPYSMLLGTPVLAAAQSGWRRCRTCHSICYTSLQGVCTSGGQHDFEGSAWYSLATAAPTDGNYQEGWRWCKRCQVLFHPGLGAGVCPVGGAHDHTGSGIYHLSIVPYASSGQEGWRYCGSCHALHRPDGGAGPCPAGGPHIETASIPYSLRLQNPIEVQCKLITDYDENQQPQSRFEVVLIPRGADGAILPDSGVKVLARSPLNIIREEKGAFVTQGLDSGTPVLFTTSAMGRVRFTIIPPQDKLALPNLFVQSAAMGGDQWTSFSPDDELHTQLAGLTGDKLTTTPAGKVAPLLPPSRAADAQALATGVSRVMTRFSPKAPAGPAPVAFGFWDDIADGFEDAGSAIAGGVGSAIDATTAAINKATEVGSSLYDTLASQAGSAIDSASRILDTVGAGAQLLIQNASSALLVPAEHFVTTSIASATQLAIDVASEVTVLALEVVDGVRKLVKIVVQTVETAAMIAVEFCKRVGLTIKAVIEFLASLFDWDAILRLQGEVHAALEAHMAGFGGIIGELRSNMPGYLQDLETKLDGLGSGGSHPPPSSSLVKDAMSVGGQFGFLLDKVLSHLGSLIPSFDLDLFSLPMPPMPSRSDIEAFASAVMASPLVGAAQDPGQLLSWSPETLLDLVKPLAKGALVIVRAVMDALLAVTPTVVAVIHQVLKQRIAIPFLTDFIEMVVFRGRQRLSLQSLLTLLIAAFQHVVGKVSQAAGGLFSFAGEQPEASLLSQRDANWMCLGGAIMHLGHQFANLTAFKGLTSEQLSGKPPYEGAKNARFVDALFILGSTALGTPFVFGTPRNSMLFVEQMLCFGLRLMGSIARMAMLKVTDHRENEEEEDGLSVSSLRWAAGSAGVLTLCASVMYDVAALNNYNLVVLRAENSGSKNLIGMDLVAQLAYGISHALRPLAVPPGLDIFRAFACDGAITTSAAMAFGYGVGGGTKQHRLGIDT